MLASARKVTDSKSDMGQPGEDFFFIQEVIVLSVCNLPPKRHFLSDANSFSSSF
jgi:hypothetical protein